MRKRAEVGQEPGHCRLWAHTSRPYLQESLRNQKMLDGIRYLLETSE